MKLPILSAGDVCRVLGGLGYVKVRQRGSHIRLDCPGRKSITIPDHREIGRGLLRKILRDAELSREEFLRLMRKN